MHASSVSFGTVGTGASESRNAEMHQTPLKWHPLKTYNGSSLSEWVPGGSKGGTAVHIGI